MKRISIERSREIRQWVYLGLAVGSALYSIYEGERKRKEIQKDLDQLVKLTAKQSNDIHSVKNKNNYIYDLVHFMNKNSKVNTKSAEEIAKENGYKTLHYSRAKWNEVKDRFGALHTNSYDDNGLYYASFNDTVYYVTID